MRILDPMVYLDSNVPEHLREGIENWIERGITPGSFLRAVIRNDLMAACLRADELSYLHMRGVIRWFVQYAPNGSYGSDKVFSNWPMFLKATRNQENSNG